METTGDAGEVKTQQCSTCDGSSASCWCVDCGEALCDDCLAAHRRVTLTRSHRVLNQQPEGPSLAFPTKFCRSHPSEELKLFCFTCCQLTCRDCQLADHKNHRFDFVSKAVESVKKQLDASMQPFKAQIEASKRSLQDMEMRLQVLAQCESFMTSKLQKHVNTLTALLNSRFEEMIKQIQKVYSVERTLITKKMEKVKLLQKSHIPLTEAAEEARNTTNLSTLVGCISQITSQLKDLADEDSYPPSKMVDVKVITDRSSVEGILNFGKLHVSWVPFSVPQAETPASSSSSLIITPPTSTCQTLTCKPVTTNSVPVCISAPPSTSPTLCSTDTSITSPNFSSNLSASSCRTVCQTGTSTGVASRVADVSLAASKDHCPPPPSSSTVSSIFSNPSTGKPTGNLLKFFESVLQSRSSASPSCQSGLPPTSVSKSSSVCKTIYAAASTSKPSQLHPSCGSWGSSANNPWVVPSASIAVPPRASSYTAPSATVVRFRTVSAVEARNPFLSSLLHQALPYSSAQAGPPSSVGPAYAHHQAAPVTCPSTLGQSSSRPSGSPQSSSSSLVSTPSSFSTSCSDVLLQTMTIEGSGRVEVKQSSRRSEGRKPAGKQDGPSEEATKTTSTKGSGVRINVLTKSQLESKSGKLFVKFKWQNKKASSSSTSSSSCRALAPKIKTLAPLMQQPASAQNQSVGEGSSEPHLQNQPGAVVQTNPQTVVQSSSSIPSFPSLSCSPASTYFIFPQVVSPKAQTVSVQPVNPVLPLVPAPSLLNATLNPVRPSLIVNQRVVPSQNRSAVLLLTNTNPVYPVFDSGRSLPSDWTQLPVLQNHTLLVQDSCESSQVPQGTPGNVSSVGRSPSAPGIQICLESSNQLLSDQHRTSSVGPLHSTLEDQQQNPDLKGMIGSNHKVQHKEGQQEPEAYTPTSDGSDRTTDGNREEEKLFSPETPGNRQVAGSSEATAPAGDQSSSETHDAEPTLTKPNEIQSSFNSPGTSNQELLIRLSEKNEPAEEQSSPKVCEVDPSRSKSSETQTSEKLLLSRTPEDLTIVLSEEHESSEHESLPEVYDVKSSFEDIRSFVKPFSPGASDDDFTVVENEPAEEESSHTVYEVKPSTSKSKEMDVFGQPASPVASEDKMSLALSEEPELGLNLSSSETSDREDEEPPSTKTKQQDYSQLHWQPTVSLLRLPLPLPGPGRPLPRYHFILGNQKDELYLQEVQEDAQSSDEDVSETISDNASDITEDFTELQSPESPLSLEVISCAACGSSSASKICTVCCRGYHRDCHVPPFGPDIWSELVCSLCQDLSDPSDPYSADRPSSPQCSSSLSLQDQRRCETLLLHLKVEGCGRFSQLDLWSDLMLISERLSHHVSPPYQTPAQVVSDLWLLFSEASQGSPLMELQHSFRKKLVETLGSELHPSLLMAPNASMLCDPEGPSSSANTTVLCSREMPKQTEEDDFMSELKLKALRKRLRDFLDLRGTPAAKRPKHKHEEV
ncbi:hypothetical protein CRENBAI_011292 [Crenichthys baileyi]|uniref:B box-type domain-containing protein n=1 Tax=Crenichthys baileyi TaxID=28760 RepID=A0AAV9R6Q5_9TELE